MNELLVAADLIRRGYHVFRCLSPHGPCDLAILRDNALLKVEVGSASRSQSGALYRVKKPAHYDFDILALIDHSGVIHYEPPLE